MRSLKRGLVQLLLLKNFFRALARQLHIKLTKFTRRSSGPKSFLRKFTAGYEFLKDLSEYNWEVIRRCRSCMKRLTSENVPAVLVYGEKDIIAVLRDLRFEAPVKVSILRERYEIDKKVGWNAVPVEMAASRSEKVIVASLINTQEKIRRLRELGVDSESIILLDERMTIV